jgi:hypothetical protein
MLTVDEEALNLCGIDFENTAFRIIYLQKEK